MASTLRQTQYQSARVSIVTSAPSYTSQIEVPAPNGAGAEKGRRDYPDGSPPQSACVRNIAPAPDTCLAHPLRD